MAPLAYFRSLVPLGSLLFGSGVGASSATPAMVRAGELLGLHAGASEKSSPPASADGDPGRTADVLSVDASLLPDPVPWPRMNADISVGTAWLLAEGPDPEKGDGRRLVTFTFDDGPFPWSTPPILELLDRYKVRATFFCVGSFLDGTTPRAAATRQAAKQIAAAGHYIGNHTHDHLRLTQISHNQVLAQIDEGAASIERVTGKKPIFFRPPYGQLDAFSEDVLRQRGAELVLWSIEAEGADGRASQSQIDPAATAEGIETHIEYAGGGIVLLHDIRRSTVPTLAKVLAWLHARRYDPLRPERVGYQIVDLPEYLRATAARPQPYSDRTSLEVARGLEWHRLHPSKVAPMGAKEGEI